MKKFIILAVGMMLASAAAKGQDVQEFQYPETDGIWYTVLDAEAKTVQTRAGSTTVTGGMSRFKYGNTYNGSLTIPATVTNNGDSYTVVKIGDLGFSGLTGISLPETLTEIGQGAFLNNQQLTSVTIPSSVTVIGESAFADCFALKSITLPDGLEAIPASLFASCSALSEVSIPSSVTSIGRYAFSNTAITSVAFSDGLTLIGSQAFYNCDGLTSLIIPENLTQIGSQAFYSCDQLTEVVCLSTTPPAISNDTFGRTTYSSATLKVPNRSLSVYKYNQLWKQFTNISPIPVDATGVTLDKTVLTLYANGTSMRIHATVTPDDATGTVTWSTSSDAIATVDQTGYVHGVSAGTATITATIGSVHADCEVTVKDILATSVTIKRLEDKLYVGQTAQMTATVVPSNSSTHIVWSSSNDEIASIDATTGIVTGVAPGQAVITATSGTVSGVYTLTVYAVEATSITLNPSSLTMKVGDSETLTTIIDPANTTDQTLTWMSNDDSIVTVVDGTVYAVGVGYKSDGLPEEGHATITVSCGNVTAVCPVTVQLTDATEVQLDSESIDLTETQTHQLVATVLPETTSNKLIEWTSSDPAVAAVSHDGLVQALKAGTATITATCGPATASCTVNVSKIPASGVILSMSALTLQASQTQQLSATVLPEGADQTVAWTSEDESVATVSPDGVVTAIAVGTTEITATAGTATASCQVNVVETPAEQVVLSTESTTINVGGSITLEATVLPANTTNTTVDWTVDNESVATVTPDGTITAIAPGTATITATCGSATASCVVTVLSPATSITLNYTELTMPEGWVEDLIATVLPANTTDLITWASSNPGVAVVNENGIVVALSEGTATITATAGTVSATCAITVLPEDIFSSVPELTVDNDGTYKVYTLDGILKLTTTDPTELDKLPRGIYILNHKLIVLPLRK